MSTRDVICLANARKKGGRCVAGLTMDGGGWIRAVSRIPDGVLYPDDYQLADGTEPKPLDVIRINLHHSKPEVHHPENWEIEKGRWQRIETIGGRDAGRFLKRFVFRGGMLMGNLDDRCDFNEYYRRPASETLTQIAPPQVDFNNKEKPTHRKQARGRFLLGPEQIYYDLPVTYPLWEPLIIERGLTLRQNEQPFVLTISLSEPYGGNCYKLIAAVILMAREEQ